jgi:carotenoid cleavage dioxygenase-like enzyme
VAANGSIYNFGVRYEYGTQVDLYELRPGTKARRIRKVQLTGTPLVHDFAVTDRHAIFVAPPLRLHPMKLLLGLQSFERSLEWHPEEGTEIVIVPFDPTQEVVRLTVDPFFLWHTANAFEDGEAICLDYVRYPDFSCNDDLREVQRGTLQRPLGGLLHRATIDVRRRRFRSDACWSVPCEFPRVAPGQQASAHRWIYASTTSSAGQQARGYLDRLAVVSPIDGRAEVISLGDETYPSEPVFVPRPDGSGERDGWLLSLVYDAETHRSYLAVLDAAHPADGPLARLHFNHHIPPTFHGTWVNESPR